MIKIPAYFDNFSSKSDRSAGLKFSTQELADEDFMVFRQHQGQFGWLCFSEQTIQDKDIPKEQIEDKSKSQSKRYRAAQYVKFIKKGGKKVDFEAWYRKHMEKLIDDVKAEIDD